ncbi:MAG TPA: EamA family transporter [Moraxellaceae bacterium]|nr:EamA family transporter [Moraxellaceae bacterium]
MKAPVYVAGFALLMVFDTLAQTSFKLASQLALPLTMDLPWLWRVFAEPWIYGAFAGYIGAFFTWMTLLRRIPVGPAFAASHLEVVSVMAVSAWLFHEPLQWARLAGAFLIVAGILCLAAAETRASEAVDVVGEAGKGAES